MQITPSLSTNHCHALEVMVGDITFKTLVKHMLVGKWTWDALIQFLKEVREKERGLKSLLKEGAKTTKMAGRNTWLKNWQR